MITVRRRELAALLTASGGLLLGSACSSRAAPVPTSPDVARDPLADPDPQLWQARSGTEMLEVPVDGGGGDSEAWSQLETGDAALEPARRQLVDFLTTAYLDPESLRGLDDGAARSRVAEVTPSFWEESLGRAWDNGDRYFYAIAFAEGYRSVGRPAISVTWLRGEDEGDPLLMVGGTFAWTVLNTASRAVGVIAYRYGIKAVLDADASIADASVRITVNGLDGCETYDAGGLLVPALAETDLHRAAQEHTFETVIGSPLVGRDALEDPDSDLLTGDEDSNAMCD